MPAVPLRRDDIPRAAALIARSFDEDPLLVHMLPDPSQRATHGPVHALQSRGLETGGMTDWSVERTARRHVAAVRAVQPHGPYHLAGHSFGALVARREVSPRRRRSERARAGIRLGHQS